MSGEPAPLDATTIERLVGEALAEDGADQDLTTNALVPLDQQGHGTLTAKQPGVMSGLAFAAAAFRLVDGAIEFRPRVVDGAFVEAGSTVAEVSGGVHGILRGERVALNFLQRLSGVATLTAQAVERVAGSETRILDTRKTTPGLRAAERYAVRAGGGVNHRDNLSSAILIKDNHIAAVRARGGSLADAVGRALAAAGPGVAVEVEVTSEAELGEAIEAGARAVLLDNFEPPALARAAATARAAGVTTEASGGITLETLGAVAGAGVHFISLGALTHSAPALDISLNLDLG